MSLPAGTRFIAADLSGVGESLSTSKSILWGNIAIPDKAKALEAANLVAGAVLQALTQAAEAGEAFEADCNRPPIREAGPNGFWLVKEGPETVLTITIHHKPS